MVFTRAAVRATFQADQVEPVIPLLLLRARTKEFICRNFSDTVLNIEIIAREMGRRTRYLHKAFQTDSQTLQKFSLNTRLEFSRTLLVSLETRNRTISELAFRAGFNSNVHLCRISPNEMRARHPAA